jgi:predicted RNase H-like HicB family nuclease
MTAVISTALNTSSWNGEHEVQTFIVPAGLVDRYLDVAMRRAVPRQVDGRWYADLPGFPGVWADGNSPKECLDELVDVLTEWIFVKLADGDRDLPAVDDIDLTVLLNQTR